MCVWIKAAGKTTWISLALAASLLLRPVSLAQQPDDLAARLLARMPPAARVGQLFVVTFPGREIDELSAIYKLIVEDRIGGVLLQPQNGNILNEGDTLTQVASLTNGLQGLAWEASRIPLPASSEEGGTTVLSPYIPLFIAVGQGGDAGLVTCIISGTARLPSPMAIGATWNPSYAEAVGKIAGEELAALGVNMLLGPSLDVLDTPRPGSGADLGVRSFGGDPYWVGRMGAAYVAGVHSGSQGRVAVIAAHFPGLGAADRPLSEEVSTVQKSLEQLKQIELAPFFAAAGSANPLQRLDGLLVSPIRYRGFQGNIYASTKPVTFDPQALQQLLALPELAAWREAGGVTVADELGVRAVHRFYDPTEQTFNSLRIALEAFMAGNDLLILSHFAPTDDWESHVANVRSTIAFFQDKYASDPTFQTRVDEAVLRILRLKLRLYNTFALSTVQVDVGGAAGLVGQRREQVASIAQEAVTLLSPPSPDLLPDPPVADERVVIFTDDRQVTLCADCTPVYAIPPDLLADALVRLYGPQATGQVRRDRVTRFTFSDLMDYIIHPSPTTPPEGTPLPPHPVEAALGQADWVLFAMLDITDRIPQSAALRRFLAERADLLRGKKVVVFAFAAPYYLDTTEIAKLSAYFGLYSHAEPFVEAAVRALFTEFPFKGAPPVSVAGVNYNLITQTQPDPNQVIQVAIVPEEEAGGTPQPPQIYQGDALRLRTSVIVDHNGHPVPDGTPVEFIFTYPQEGLERTVSVTTLDGVAESVVTLDRTGQLQISVRAEPVPRAVRMEMDIRPGEPAVVVPITPTPSPTPLPTPTPTPAPTPAATPVPAGETDQGERHGLGGVGWLDLVEGLAVPLGLAVLGYAGLWRRNRDLSQALRGALWALAGGLAAYVALALELPGVEWAGRMAGQWRAGILGAIGAAVPLVVIALAEALREGHRNGDAPRGG